MEKRTFIDVKNEYIKMREYERMELVKSLADFLKHDNRFVVKKGSSGKGKCNYSSAKRFDNDRYDLSNWKWVEITMPERNNHSCVISLNMLERDPNSGNEHALYDRIGFFVSASDETYGVKVDERQIITNIDLPLNDEKKDIIKNILQEVVIKQMWKMDFSIN